MFLIKILFRRIENYVVRRLSTPFSMVVGLILARMAIDEKNQFLETHFHPHDAPVQQALQESHFIHRQR
jgi:hypothetical protein